MKLRKQMIFCLNCTSINVNPVLIVDKNFSIYKCSDCSIIFTFPQPKQVSQINNTIYNSEDELNSRILNFDVEYKRAKEHMLSVMKYKKSGKYLDVGCSYGISVKAAQDFGFDAYGIEPTPRAAKYAKEVLHLAVTQTTLEKAKFKANSFDVISLYDVLEHIPNLHTFLAEIKRILKPKGLLVIQSPNIESYAFVLLKQNWNWLLVPNHLWHFSRQSLSNLLKNSGFSIKGVITEDNVYDFSSNLTSKIFGYKVSRIFFEKVIHKMIYLTCYMTILIGTKIWHALNKGGSIQVYATKE